jgi:Rad3-related DNA helicase
MILDDELLAETFVPPALDLDSIDKHFPKEAYRDGQKETIEFAVNAFNSGKKIVILECPTGSGKSAIGMTIANMVRKSYYLTITKILQDQLTGDFGKAIVELKGRNAYACTFYNRFGQSFVDKMLWSPAQLEEYKAKDPDCATGFCRTKWNKSSPKDKKFSCEKCFLRSGVGDTGKPKGELDTLPPGMTYSACPYYEQVHRAIRASRVVMNFSSFLYQTQMTNRFDDPRDLMIIDECHNVEPQLLDFISFSITDQYLSSHGIFIPELDHAYEYKVWMEDAKVHEVLYERIKQAREEENSKLEDELSRVLKKYKMFMDNMEDRNAEWVCEYDEKAGGKGKSHRRVTLKPVFAQRFAHRLLFKYTHRVLMMSATVLDVNVMCRSLGIDRSHVAAYRVKNRFPKENRPIHIKAVAKMTGGKQRMGEWGPLLVEAVNEIVKKHKGEKGIIHTHNFAIMDYLIRRCSSDVKSRFLDQRKFDGNKKAMLAKHSEGRDSILIAPAMHEGIDLIDDLSRFQVICKVPYPNCFDDEQLARRVEVDRRYYTWLTALKLVQSYGRSVRSMDDHAVTYILDESIYKFMDDAGGMLPGWFLEAIV